MQLLQITIGVVEEGVSPSCNNNVSSPRLHIQRGAVRTDLYAEAPQYSGILCSYSAGVRCLATAAVLVTFAAKSDIQRIKFRPLSKGFKEIQLWKFNTSENTAHVSTGRWK